MKSYTIDDVKVEARNVRTAQRRVRGFKRGELTIEGKTIPAKDRKPMRKKS